MSRNRKKTIRLTETEMVDLIERIVNEVKNQKKRSIQENTTKRRKVSRRPVSRRR